MIVIAYDYLQGSIDMVSYKAAAVKSLPPDIEWQCREPVSIYEYMLTVSPGP